MPLSHGNVMCELSHIVKAKKLPIKKIIGIIFYLQNITEILLSRRIVSTKCTIKNKIYNSTIKDIRFFSINLFDYLTI